VQLNEWRGCCSTAAHHFASPPPTVIFDNFLLVLGGTQNCFAIIARRAAAVRRCYGLLPRLHLSAGRYLPPHLPNRLMTTKSSLAEVNSSGAFVRSPSQFTQRIGSELLPAVAGRYMLYVSLACPWACRCLAARALKGLEHVIPVTIVAPTWVLTRPLKDDHRSHSPCARAAVIRRALTCACTDITAGVGFSEHLLSLATVVWRRCRLLSQCSKRTA
jgi:hypothetical protein